MKDGQRATQSSYQEADHELEPLPPEGLLEELEADRGISLKLPEEGEVDPDIPF